MRRRVLDWYHFYLNCLGGIILAKTTWYLCYWKGLVVKSELYVKPCKICQQFKRRKNIYVRLPPKNIAELKPCDTVHADLIDPYINSIRQYHMGGAIIESNFSLYCMAMIDPAKGWLEIVEVLTYDIYEVTGGDDGKMDKSYARKI